MSHAGSRSFPSLAAYKAGLLTRAPDPSDRRTIRLDPPWSGGKSALGVVQSALGELNGKITDGFSARELAVVTRWLVLLRPAVVPSPRYLQ